MRALSVGAHLIFLQRIRPLSLVPSFSWVKCDVSWCNRFSGFVAGKPLKRFNATAAGHTQLKLGANEKLNSYLQETGMRLSKFTSEKISGQIRERPRIVSPR